MFFLPIKFIDNPLECLPFSILTILYHRFLADLTMSVLLKKHAFLRYSPYFDFFIGTEKMERNQKTSQSKVFLVSVKNVSAESDVLRLRKRDDKGDHFNPCYRSISYREAFGNFQSSSKRWERSRSSQGECDGSCEEKLTYEGIKGVSVAAAAVADDENGDGDSKDSSVEQ